MFDHDVHVDRPDVCPLGVAVEGAIKEGFGMLCVPKTELQLCKPWNNIHIWNKQRHVKGSQQPSSLWRGTNEF